MLLLAWGTHVCNANNGLDACTVMCGCKGRRAVLESCNVKKLMIEWSKQKCNSLPAATCITVWVVYTDQARAAGRVTYRSVWQCFHANPCPFYAEQGHGRQQQAAVSRNSSPLFDLFWLITFFFSLFKSRFKKCFLCMVFVWFCTRQIQSSMFCVLCILTSQVNVSLSW